MVNKKFVCKYPQYSFCGDFHCRLSKYCSLYQRYYPKSYERGYHNPINKTPEERKQHNQNYILYNTLFSNYKEKKKMIQKRWYENNRKKEKNNCIIKKCFSVMCNLDCFNCEYEDCIVNDEDYHKMYYKYNHDKLLEKKAQYRANNNGYFLAFLCNYMCIQIRNKKQLFTIIIKMENGTKRFELVIILMKKISWRICFRKVKE